MRPVRRLAVLGTTIAAAALVVAAPAAAAEGEIIGAAGPDAIEDSYIVVYADSAARGADALTERLTGKYGVIAEHTYRYALHGFAGTFDEATAKKLAADPAVDYVQQNARVRATDIQPNPPSWGLDRIDQRDLPVDSGYTYPNTAASVTAYIIDTGIRTSHQDFGGRATWGTNTVDTTDTDTAPTSPARSAALPTAWPRACG